MCEVKLSKQLKCMEAQHRHTINVPADESEKKRTKASFIRECSIAKRWLLSEAKFGEGRHPKFTRVFVREKEDDLHSMENFLKDL